MTDQTNITPAETVFKAVQAHFHDGSSPTITADDFFAQFDGYNEQDMHGMDHVIFDRVAALAKQHTQGGELNKASFATQSNLLWVNSLEPAAMLVEHLYQERYNRLITSAVACTAADRDVLKEIEPLLEN